VETLVTADGTSTWVWDTAANGVGKLHSRSNAGFTETFTYNSAGRLSKVVTGITPIGGSGSTNYTTSHTYDSNGRPLNTTYPGGFVLTRAYNANGYLSQLKSGAAAIQTISGMDAFGNSISESYANGVSTLRTFDPETGRLTDVNTTKGSTVLQNNDYAWRSNGTLESRIANPAIGLATTRKENFTYDVLNRVTLAETYIGSSNTRDLSYAYNELGNITSSTSTAMGDRRVDSELARPHRRTQKRVKAPMSTLAFSTTWLATSRFLDRYTIRKSL
jgi:YD repeat-containing protein